MKYKRALQDWKLLYLVNETKMKGKRSRPLMKDWNKMGSFLTCKGICLANYNIGKWGHSIKDRVKVGDYFN